MLRRHRRRDGGHPQRDQAQRGRPHRLHRLREGRSSSAARGARTRTPGSRATCPRTSTRTRSRSRPTGATGSRPGPEIRAYFERVAREHDVLPHVRFGDEVTSCTFANGRWQLDNGERSSRRGRRRDRGHRRAAPPAVSRHRRARLLRRRACSTARAGTTACRSTARASASSAPARPRCRWCRRSSAGSRSCRCSSAPRNGSCRRRTPRTPTRRRRSSATIPARLPALHTQLAEMFGIFANAVIDSDSPEIKMIEDACLANLENNVRDPELRERLRPTYRAGVQAADHLPRLLRRDPATERRARHRGDRARSSRRRAHPRRPAARARRARARDRVQRRRVHAADAASPAATGTRSTRPGRRGRTRTCRSRSPTSRTSSCSTARTDRSATSR